MELLAWILVGFLAAASAALFWLWRRSEGDAVALEEALTRDTSANAALAAAAERARIAREMHDVVAHTLSVVVAQADGGRFAAKTDPEAALHTLDTIAEVSRSALTEMRALLGVLRDSDGEAAMGPQPSLADIPVLVAAMREGGLNVSYVTTGTPRPLPIGAGLTLYRVAQESLTNVLKHAGPSPTAYVQLTWEDDSVGLVISDDGRGAAARGDGSGTGITGMHERVALFGGTLGVGPKAGGGFVVRAILPLGERGILTP